MDFMELERERGITIQSAATYCEWKGNHVNIIDTPGHVDFTIEVERSLRVLDGAILVLCGVAGVQSQSMTVDRQMRRYKVPRLAFVNKLDRSGANPRRVVEGLRDKLKLNAVLMQIPIGLEADFRGIVDLVTMKALRFEGDNGEHIVEEEIPAALRAEAEAAREQMLDAVSMFSDELTEAILEEKVTEELIHAAVRKGVLSLQLCPVFLGTAYKNKGVQPLLDAVNAYLPSPEDVENTRGRSRERRAADRALLRPEQAAGRARLQARGRPLRAAHLRARLPGHARARAHAHQHAHQEAREGGPPGAHARERDGGDRGVRGRRHRGAVRHRLRLGRHVHRRQHRRGDELDVRARGRHLTLDQAEGLQEPGEHQQGARPLRARGPDLPRAASIRRAARPSSRAWASCTSTSTSSA